MAAHHAARAVECDAVLTTLPVLDQDRIARRIVAQHRPVPGTQLEGQRQRSEEEAQRQQI